LLRWKEEKSRILGSGNGRYFGWEILAHLWKLAWKSKLWIQEVSLWIATDHAVPPDYCCYFWKRLKFPLFEIPVKIILRKCHAAVYTALAISLIYFHL
jgi:hypothetical protein